MIVRMALLGTLLAVTTMPAVAQKIYKYTDSNGNIIYAESLPRGASGKEIKPWVKRVTPQEARAQLDALSARAKVETASKDDAQAATRNKENCDIARKNLEVLNSSPRIQATDDKGQIYYLDDEQKQERTAQTQEQIAQFCGS